MIAQQFLIQNLVVTFTGKKKPGLFLSFIPPPYWVFSVAFSTLIAVTWEEQMQPTDGLNHPSFPVAFIVFFTVE